VYIFIIQSGHYPYHNFIATKNPPNLARITTYIVPKRLNLETAVESRKYRQALGAPRKTEKLLITNKVTTNFSVSLCTPVSYLSFSHLTAVSRLKRFDDKHIPDTKKGGSNRSRLFNLQKQQA
jgi:hypothetical protein